MEIVCNTNKVLGMGSIANCYKGVWRRQQVAVKRFLLHDACIYEEDDWRKLDHENVIKLLYAESNSDFRYYAIELCQASLDKLFLNDGDPQKYCGPMPPREDVLHQLAVGLEYIHSNELIHGNIKPANVLIWVDSNSSPDRKVLMKWADFKLSTLNHEIKGSTLSERAFEWLAPEISEMLGIEETEEFELSGATSSRLKLTNKSDVFAAGLVFGYFLLDGRHLYGSVSRDIIININKQNPVDLKAIVAIRPKNARYLILNMLECKPENRITSFEVVIEIEAIRRIRTREEEDIRYSTDSLSSDDTKKESTASSTDFKGTAEMTTWLDTAEKQKWFYSLCEAETFPSFIAIKDLIGVVNCIYSQELTPLHLGQSKTIAHYLCEDNLQQIFHIWIKKGADINFKDKRGNNVLHLLCQKYRGNNLYDLINLLILYGIEITCKAVNGWDALLLLCENYQNNDFIDIIQLFIKNGMKVESSKNDIGNNALLLMCQHYRNNNLFELVNLFIECGIEANYKNYFGWNALHFLCQNVQIKNLIDAISLLIHKGIDINSKTSSGENAIFYLLQNYMEDSLLDEPLRLLIRYGIQFRCERRVNEYYEMLQKRGIEVRNGGLEILKYMAEEDLTLGWHSHCKSCEDILSIEDTSRRHLQHHYMFGNTRITFQLVLEEFKKSDKSLDVRNATEWLLKKSQEESTKEDSEDFQTMAKLSEQVKRGGNSTLFECNQYEDYLRCLHRMAKKIKAVKSMKQIEFFYLLPFDFPFIPYPVEKASDQLKEIWTTKMEWDKTLYNWMHRKGDEDFGKSLQEDANRFCSAFKNVKLNCHQ